MSAITDSRQMYAARDNRAMKRLIVLAVVALGGCSQHSAQWFAAAAPQVATAVHRHHVRTELRKIREAQARRRVVVVPESAPREGRGLGIALAAKAEGGLDTEAERARFRTLSAEEQEACLASYARHAPRGEAGRTVLESLWAERD